MNNKCLRIVSVMLLVLAASFGMADEELAESEKSEPRVIAVVLGEEIRDDAPPDWEDYLHHAVWTRLSAKYVRENKLEATEEEIEEFLEWKRSFREQSRAENEEEIANLKAELAGDELNEKERTQKEATLSMLETFLKRRDWSSNLTPEENERLSKSERILAGIMVTRWKVNKSLFEKYGGRVVFQQAGMEPYDAYRQFLKDQEKAGAFTILDDQLRSDYWSKWPEEPVGVISEGEEAKEDINRKWWVEVVEEE